MCIRDSADPLPQLLGEAPLPGPHGRAHLRVEREAEGGQQVRLGHGTARPSVRPGGGQRPAQVPELDPDHRFRGRVQQDLRHRVVQAGQQLGAGARGRRLGRLGGDGAELGHGDRPPAVGERVADLVEPGEQRLAVALLTEVGDVQGDEGRRLGQAYPVEPDAQLVRRVEGDLAEDLEHLPGPIA